MRFKFYVVALIACITLGCKSYLGQADKFDQASSSTTDGGAGGSGGTGTFTVGGTLSGLSGTLVLQNNGGDNLTLTSNGNFTFATALPNGENYDVTVLTNPVGQVCHVRDNQGTIAGANVTNIVVHCASDSGWTQDAYLKASNIEANDQFGYSVAISGSTIVVGAPQEDSNATTIENGDGLASGMNGANNSGAVYVFKRDASGNWIQDAYLKASNAEANDEFGRAVAISGSTIVVGAYKEDSNQTTITNDDNSASGVNGANESGAVYVFKRDANGNWTQDAYLKASNAEAGDTFGHAVAISGSTIVVGAPQEDSNATTIENGDG
ncbi:MAG: FG-GAP repeat protein, partial [Leptospiraceae bacterium]|nr:FG-GAP repeat protein [Leptospiraceae bacterium]